MLKYLGETTEIILYHRWALILSQFPNCLYKIKAITIHKYILNNNLIMHVLLKNIQM